MSLATAPLVLFLSVVVLQTPAANQTPPADFKVEILGEVVADFSARMTAYANLRRRLEDGLTPLRVTDDPSEIIRAETALAERIRLAREGSRRGEIFTPKIRAAFRQILRAETNAGRCASILNDNPGEFSYPVNGTYPKEEPLSTVPPGILTVLPRLPSDVLYRFLRRDLILHDTRANVILDRIDEASRCPRELR